MDHFDYISGELYCEQTPVARIAHDVGTPVYVYSAATFRDHYDAVAGAFQRLNPTICYSVKCCANIHICRLLRDCGAGFDVVSGGELARVLAAGGDPAGIVYAGVGKTDEEINQALDARIGWFNIESEAELDNLATIAAHRGVQARAALRVNPDVDPRTHHYTTTGTKETKFGVDLERAHEVFRRFGRREDVLLRGIHLHIGSPVNDVGPYVEAIAKGLALIDRLRSDEYEIEMLDIGGGFGANYRAEEAPPAVRYAEAIVPLLEGRGLQIVMEPGRSIAANAGILVARVLYRKGSGDREFVIIDAGMNDLLRPALYQAYHFIWPVHPPAGLIPDLRGEAAALPGLTPVDVVGPVCETADSFAQDRPLPPVQRGDLLAIFTSGAYGMSMSSNYNSRRRAAEVLVDGSRYREIRRRDTYDHLMAAERTE